MMRRAAYLFVFMCALLYTNDSNARKDCKSLIYGSNVYKHFVGTVGKRKVALDFRFGFCGGSNFGGSYVHEAGSNNTKLLMIYEPEKFEYDAQLQATEYFIDDNWLALDRGEHSHPVTWQFTIKGHRLNGKCYGGDIKDSLKIDMVEDYSGAFALEATEYNDSMKKYFGTTALKATYGYDGVVPAVAMPLADAHIINAQLVAQLGYSGSEPITITDYEKQAARMSFEAFTKKCQQLITDTPVDNLPTSVSSGFTSMFPVYNGDGLLTMEYQHYNSGVNLNIDKHGYFCLDVTRNKIWHLNEMVSDYSELTNIIQKEYKSRKEQHKLIDMPMEQLVPTDNIILTPAGLVFCYISNDELAMVPELRVFVPYSKLRPVLTSDFRGRMKI